MTTRHEHRPGFAPAWGWVVVLVLGGCQSPQPTAGSEPHASPSVNAPSAVDVRTEANIIEMENRYIAEKNSQPTHQHEAEAEKKRKEAAAAKAAETAKVSDTPKTREAARAAKPAEATKEKPVEQPKPEAEKQAPEEGK